MRPKYKRPDENQTKMRKDGKPRKQREKIPSPHYTGEEEMAFIKRKDKDLNNDVFKKIEKDLAHVKPKK